MKSKKFCGIVPKADASSGASHFGGRDFFIGLRRSFANYYYQKKIRFNLLNPFDMSAVFLEDPRSIFFFFDSSQFEDIMSHDFIVVFVTAANRAEAELIGQALVEKNLAACCNLVEPIFSIFRWEGKVCRENEVLLIIKSVKDRFDVIVTEVKKLHSYQTPEIIALPIVAGSEDYLSWIKAETK